MKEQKKVKLLRACGIKVVMMMADDNDMWNDIERFEKSGELEVSNDLLNCFLIVSSSFSTISLSDPMVSFRSLT